jgi:DNA topoisomerase-2
MEEKLEYSDFKEHAKKRSMWIGSNLLSSNNFWVLENGIFKKQAISTSEALLKVFDEILVNATDAYIKYIETPTTSGGPVSRIDVKFNHKTGEISVENNGRGIPVQYEEKIKQYSVQALISREFSGSNFDDTNLDKCWGGLNGLGMKVVNINCNRFEIETIDFNKKLKYRQVCSNGLDVIEEPEITKIGNRDKSYTRVTFMPNYAHLCRVNQNDPNPDWVTPQNLADFYKLIETRVYQTAVFINNINYRYEGHRRINYNKKASIFLNDREIRIKNLTEYARMFGIEDMVEFKLESAPEISDEEAIRFPWSLCIGYANSAQLSGADFTLVNGIYLPDGGNHINVIYNKIKSGMQENIETILKDTNIKFQDSMIKSMLVIFNVKQFALPQFAGQTKTAITIGLKEINHMKKIYNVPEKVIDKIWKMVKEAFEYKVSQQDLKNATKKKKLTKIRKYEKAEKLGVASGLFIPEGDSAALPIRNILTSRESPISRKTYGMYNIQGVPPNVCKKTKEIMIDGKLRIRQDRDLQDNIAFNGLLTALNLDYTLEYYIGDDAEKTKQGDKEFKTLNYGHIIISTDQDLDGVGNICSLIIVYILTFWPCLIKRGFVKRLQTPLIRVYLPGKSAEVLEFYSDKEYRNWVNQKYGDEDLMPSDVKKGVCYYKGLGGHTPEEVLNMGRNIFDNIITLPWDDACKMKMKLYYGTDTDERKEVLLTPVTAEYTEAMLTSRQVPISSHFDIETKTFQLYFMQRKLKAYMDGMVPSQRKAFAGARNMFRSVSKAKVYQVTGDVTKKMHYQHGDTSMNETIIKMAQNFTGSNNIPSFVPISNGFGDRVTGRGISASPRYIDTCYNSKVMDLIFPPDDDYLLEYTYTDGERSEPKYYLPIIPYAILETTTTAGVGWKIGTWGRDYDWTMLQLRQMIKLDYPNAGKPFGFLTKAWLPKNMRIMVGATSTSKVSEICLGEYDIDYEKNTVTITQLPLKIWSYKYKCALLGINPANGKTEDKDGKPYPSKEWVDDVIDNTGNDQNHILIKLKPGAMEYIEKYYGTDTLDPYEDYLGIYQILTPHLNMISPDNSIREFENYEEVMESWFILRKDLYIKRLERLIILLELRILYHKEILRFIVMDEKKEINIDKKTKEVRYKILEQDGKFVKFNKTNLLRPKYLKADELRRYILEINATYDYIDDITKGMTEEAEIKKLEKKIQEMEAELADLREKTWASLWLEELEKLDQKIKEGIATKWLFEKKQHIFKSFVKK